MRIGLLALSGLRAWDQELFALGLAMPGFVERKEVIAQLPSLGLLTLAGLTPHSDHATYHEVFDASQTKPPEDDFDLVAISSFTAQIEDAYQLADFYQREGIRVVLGGLHVSMLPDEAAQHADTVVIGEAEEVWPALLDDARRGRLQPVYQAARPWNLADSPIPRFELLDPGRYNRLTVQTSRGCPWKCEFCASSILIAPRYQLKPVDKVVEEVRRIKSIWPRPFLEFADDNTFVDKAHSKALMRALIPEEVRFFTETDLSFADDLELIQLAKEAGCRQVLIGFESPGIDELRGVELQANWKWKHADRARAAIERIQSAGITVNGCFVLGLDGQLPDVFDDLLNFVERSGLYDVQVTLQTPFPGTPLYRRLKSDGRLFANRFWEKCTLFDLTHHPARMSADDLRAGLIRVSQSLYADDATTLRHARFFEQLRTRKPSPSDFPDHHDVEAVTFQTRELP